MRIAKIKDHAYMFSSERQQWFMVECGCDVTAQVCKFPRKMPVGGLMVAGKRVNYVSVPKHKEPYWEQAFDHALMQEGQGDRCGEAGS